MGAKTIAVKWGMLASKIVAVLFLVFTIAALLYILLEVLNREHKIYFYYLNVLNLFLLFIGLKIITAKTKIQFNAVSTMVKISMLIGICLMPLYYFIEF